MHHSHINRQSHQWRKVVARRIVVLEDRWVLARLVHAGVRQDAKNRTIHEDRPARWAVDHHLDRPTVASTRTGRLDEDCPEGQRVDSTTLVIALVGQPFPSHRHHLHPNSSSR